MLDWLLKEREEIRATELTPCRNNGTTRPQSLRTNTRNDKTRAGSSSTWDSKACLFLTIASTACTRITSKPFSFPRPSLSTPTKTPTTLLYDILTKHRDNEDEHFANCWLVECIINLLTNQLIEWWINWVVCWLIYWMAGWLNDRFIDFDWLVE